MTVSIKDDLTGLLYAKAKRESKTIAQVVNEILTRALWDEPGVLFKGKYFKIEEDLFGFNKPSEQI